MSVEWWSRRSPQSGQHSRPAGQHHDWWIVPGHWRLPPERSVSRRRQQPARFGEFDVSWFDHYGLDLCDLGHLVRGKAGNPFSFDRTSFIREEAGDQTAQGSRRRLDRLVAPGVTAVETFCQGAVRTLG